jgi:hypothetical protein
MELSLDKFKNKTFKPFLAIVIYHELTHSLVKKINKKREFEDSSTSLNLNSKTNGCKILKIVY